MKRAMLLLVVMSGVLLFVTHPVQAIPITVDFTVTYFYRGDDYPPAPTNPVSGTIVYDAASTTADINSITSINLTIDGHTYGISEIIFQSLYENHHLIGGSLDGGDITPGTDDFRLMWHKDTLTPDHFYYSSVNSITTYGVSTDYEVTGIFNKFTVTSAPVPIPGALVLFGSGLVGLAGISRKWFKK